MEGPSVSGGGEGAQKDPAPAEEDPFDRDVGSPRWALVCHPHQLAEIEAAAATLDIALLPRAAKGP